MPKSHLTRCTPVFRAAVYPNDNLCLLKMIFFHHRWRWTVSQSGDSLPTRTRAVRTVTYTSLNRTDRPCPAVGVARLGHQHITTAKRTPLLCWSGCTHCLAWTTQDTTLILDWVIKCSTGTVRSYVMVNKKYLQVSTYKHLWQYYYYYHHIISRGSILMV